MAWQDELRANLGLFNGKKRQWQPEELAIAYRVYNGYYGTALRDTGCGSCRRSVLAHCHKIAVKFASEVPPNLNDNSEVDN